MNPPHIFLVDLQSSVEPVVRAAAQAAFPNAIVVEVPTLAEAAQTTGSRGPELLVLVEPDNETATRAVLTADANGTPRWAVVILGFSPAYPDKCVVREDWNPRLLAWVFRNALRQRSLQNENLRLRGDLQSVARRIRHDMNSPVGCIHTSASVLELLTPPAEPAFATMVDNIKESAREISALLERTAFVLRAAAEPFTTARVDMSGVVSGVLTKFERTIRDSGATVTQPARWPEANGVSKWLQVIWENLLENALKFGGPEARIRLDWSRADDEWCFSVTDRGAGVPAPQQANLFRPFEQLHLSRNTGLGLSIVQRLVALQGGLCGYERTADGSSRFFFTLPVAESGTTGSGGAHLLAPLRAESQ